MAFHRRLSTVATLLGLVASATSSTLMAEASVQSLSGKVQVLRSGASSRWQELSAPTTLRDGDLVKTGSDGLVTLLGSDGRTFELRPETLFEVRSSPKR